MRARRLLLTTLALAACGDPAATTDAAPSTDANTTSSSTADPGTTDEPITSTPTTTAPTSDAPDATSDPATTHTVGGTVTGLQGAGLALSLGGAPLEISGDGPFTFPDVFPDGAAYEVTVAAQPADPAQLCSVAAGAGEVSGADITDVAVTCVTTIHHVVVIGIDGLGGAYIPMLDMPNLAGLTAVGAHTLAMQNALPTMSAPNWMSMIAGAGPDQHGVDSNEWSPGDSQPTPTIFAVLRQQVPDAKIGVFHDWDGFGALVEPGVPDHIESPGDEAETTAAAIAFLKSQKPELLFVHLDLVDHAGHFHGWGSDDYLAAAATADALIGDILQAIDDAGLAADTAVIVSADHGGDGLSHGDDTSLERPIPFVVRAPQLAPTLIEREVRIWDLAPTVAALLKIDAPASWLASPVVEATVDLDLPPGPPEPLELLEVDEYTWVYDDSGSGATDDVSIWRPVVPAGHVALGDVAVPGHAAPLFPTLVVRDDPAAVRPPLGYEQIWNDAGSLGTHDVALWSPIPPLGYACLGSVAIADHDAVPSTDEIRCIHLKYLVPGERALAWTDAGSLAFQDAGLWTCIPGDAGGLAARSFITRRHHSDGGYDRKCWSIAPRGA